MRRPARAFRAAAIAAALCLFPGLPGTARAAAQAPGWHGRYVAGIEMLTASPTFATEAAARLKRLHASTVYLYVAYQGQAFFPLPAAARRDGLTMVNDALPTALSALHARGYRVVLAVSTTLLDRTDAPRAGRAILQPGSNVINPVASASLLAALVRRLASYRPDGLYVGEPFDWAGYTPPPGAWLAFYRRLAVAARPVQLDMLLPTMHNEYGSIPRTYGSALDVGLARSGLFGALGIDAEGMVPRAGVDAAVNARWASTSPYAFARASAALGGRHALDEIPITNSYHLGAPAPVAIVRRAVAAAEAARVEGIVVFADEYLSAYPRRQQAQISALLATFVRGPAQGG